MNSIEMWRRLHQRGYFIHHPYFDGGRLATGIDLDVIRKYRMLNSSMNALVIGSGYGRESALIAPHVRVLYAIDFEETHVMARRFLGSRNIRNVIFVPISPTWDENIPKGIDIVYTITVVQHLERSVTTEYFKRLHDKMNPDGSLIVQFCNCLDGGTFDIIPGTIYEPQVNWTIPQIRTMLSLLAYEIAAIDTRPCEESGHHFEWYWVHFHPKIVGQNG